MATKTYISTKGFEEYLERIVAAGKDIDAAALNALQAGAEVARKGMVVRVAKDTMNLQDHIQIDGPHQDGNYSFVEVGIINKKEFTDANTARYGNAQEYGTSSMPAHPFIRPTMTGDKRKIMNAIKASLFADEVMM